MCNTHQDACSPLATKHIMCNTHQDGYRLRLKWYVDQTGEKVSLMAFQHVLGFGRVELKSGTTDAWRLITDSLKSADILIPYFNQFLPKTNKLFLRFIRYQRVRHQ
jgi:hypothetical protein